MDVVNSLPHLRVSIVTRNPTLQPYSRGLFFLQTSLDIHQPLPQLHNPTTPRLATTSLQDGEQIRGQKQAQLDDLQGKRNPHLRQMEDPKYCSPECQRTDWAVHKLLCASLKNFATPPAPNMRRAIYFKHDSEKPVYRWATTHHNEDEGQVYDNNHMEILGHSFGMLRVEVNPVRNKKLKNYIDIMYCNDLMGCSGTVEPQNDCLLKILVTPCRDWFAPEPREKTT